MRGLGAEINPLTEGVDTLYRRLLTLLPVLAVTFFVSLSAGSSGVAVGVTSAAAAEDHFCGYVLQPGWSCQSDYFSSWRRVRSRYPGSFSDNVVSCVYMYNFRTQRTRGGMQYCGKTWSRPGENPLGHDYGPTAASDNDYASFNRLASLPAHTLIGWTSTG